MSCAYLEQQIKKKKCNLRQYITQVGFLGSLRFSGKNVKKKKINSFRRY